MFVLLLLYVCSCTMLSPIYGGFVQKGLEANKMWEKRILCPKISVGSFTRIFFQLAYCLTPVLHVLNYRQQDRKLTLKHLIFPSLFKLKNYQCAMLD